MTQKITLNKQQKHAVEYNDGPLLIIAGAGTGKTAVITQKIKYLIDNKLALPEEILALTFTEKAAEEMKDRVDALVGTGYLNMQISTFHAFCQKILEARGLDIGLPNRFKLLTETDAWLLVRKNLDNFKLDYYRPLGNPTRHIHELIRHFSKCKDELISPEDYLEYAESVKLDKDDAEREEKTRLTEISNAYHSYNQLLLDNQSLDFGDLIYYANVLITKRPNVLKELQQEFKYILVDEFQDVNWAQYNLVRQIAKDPNVHLSVVGDDDQAIYAFRGASVSNIMRFKDDFPKAEEAVLVTNYRSGQKILDTAYESIQFNNPDRLEEKLKIDKKLKSGATIKAQVIESRLPTIDEEANFVVNEINKLKDSDKNFSFDDVAILVRANSHADPFINAFQKNNIPYEQLSSNGLFREPIVLDVINLFKVLDSYHESTAIYRLLHLPFLNISESDLQKFTHYAKKKSISYYEALRRSKEIKLSDAGKEITDKLVEIIHEGMKLARTEKPTTVLYNFLDQSGYLKYLATGEDEGNRQIINRIYQLKQFFEYINNYQANTPDAKIYDFLAHLNFVTESGDEGQLYQAKDTPESVNIMTVHASKGLEFKYVFLVNLTEERFPSRRQSEGIEIPRELIKETLPEGDAHIQEERRLFYVGLTRAKERLYLVSAQNYGGVRAKKPSRFLVELGFQDETLKRKDKEKISLTPEKKKIEDKGEFIYELPKAFSFSQIKSYESCPYQYKLANILRLPTGGSPTFSFGQTIHATMQKFYTEVQEMNNAKQESLFSEIKISDKEIKGVKVPSFERLEEIYRESWQEDWYKSKKQREDYFTKGLEIIKKFYKDHKDSWTVPIGLEQWFKVKVGEYLIHGRIDRVDQLPDKTLEIVDYKTGNAKKELKSEDKDQLYIYQIAATELPEFINLGKVKQLTFYYVNEGLKMSFLGKEKDLEKFKEKIIKILDKIKSRDFTATPNKFTCQFCDFKDICEYKK